MSGALRKKAESASAVPMGAAKAAPAAAIKTETKTALRSAGQFHILGEIKRRRIFFAWQCRWQ
jgi:hypothetical protein